MRVRGVLVALLIIAVSGTGAVGQEPEWSRVFSPPGFGFGGGYEVIRDATVIDGETWVCGQFTSNGVTPLRGLAKWDGSAWQSEGNDYPFSRAPSFVASYAGELVSSCLEIDNPNIGPYRWTGTDWEMLGTGLTSGYYTQIRVWAIYQGDLVVAGDFGATGGGVETRGIARWDGTSWSPLGNGIGLTRFPFAMEVYQGDLYVAGSISADGVHDLARWDGASWTAVVAWDPTFSTLETGFTKPDYGWYSEPVQSLAVHDGKLVIGGCFGRVGSLPAANVAFYDATGPLPVWELPNAGTQPGAVRALESYDGQLYAGGDPGMVPGAAGTGTLGIVGDSGWIEIGEAPDGPVTMLLDDGTNLCVAGDYERVAGFASCGWIQWDGSQFVRQQNPAGLGLSARSRELVIYDGDLLAVGDFASAGELEVRGVARWDGRYWAALPGGGTPGVVYDAFADGMDLYVAGTFDEIGGITSGNVARFDGTQWHSYPHPPDTEIHGLEAVAYWSGSLYVGGGAQIDGPGPAISGFIYRWDGSQWELLHRGFPVTDFADYGSELLVAGDPSGGEPGIRTYDGTTLTTIPFTDSSDAVCTKIHVENGLAYLAKKYVVHDGDWQRYVVVTWDGVELSGFGPFQTSSAQPGPYYGLFDSRDVWVSDGTTYVVGRSSDEGYAGPGYGCSIWRWDGVSPTWEAVDGGTNGTAYAVAGHGGAIYLGGRMTRAGADGASQEEVVPKIVSRAIARFGIDTIVGRGGVVNRQLVLEQNTPNPFNPHTTIEFEIPSGGGHMDLRVFDLRGRLVRQLRNDFHAGGQGRVVWDGRDDAGRSVASGSYLCVLRVGEAQTSRKMLLVQ